MLTVRQEFRLFVRNNGSFDASADISIRGESLGKWLVTREPKAWHNIGRDSLFKFQDSYGTNSPALQQSSTGRPTDHVPKVFEPSTIELRFQYLSQVAEGQDQDGFVPIIVREPTLDDGPSCVPSVFVSQYCIPPNKLTLTVHRLSDALMQSQFETMEDDPFSTFVILFHPPPTTSPSIPTPANPEPAPEYLRPPAGPISLSEGGSTTISDSIFQLEDALSEHKKTRFLLPARLTPELQGKLVMSEFCRKYELLEDIPSVLAQLRIKDAHVLSRVYLRDLRDKGMALRSINMLQLAVIRFSSKSTP
ncbi:hypothetical protein BJY52DRAFT_1406941 [Lactarius psammicola]|nr:hypothetical protein BJY52DRAFT_1406941 [Lactarius psammicola]